MTGPGPLRYIGPTSGSDGDISTYSWAEGEAATVAVTTAFVNNQIAIQTPPLTTQSYINSQLPFRATQAQVNTDQANYVNSSQMGAAGGVATYGSDGYVTPSQVPSNMPTENLVQCYSASNSSYGQIALTGTHTVTTTTITEYTAATIHVPNPGYSYIPLPFVYIQGSAGGSQSSRQTGTGNYGQITVMPPTGSSNTNIYALGVCTATPHMNWYYAIPTCDINGGSGSVSLQTSPAITPQVIAPVTGALTLQANLCNWSGTGYTFSGVGLVFFVLTFPAI